MADALRERVVGGGKIPFKEKGALEIRNNANEASALASLTQTAVSSKSLLMKGAPTGCRIPLRGFNGDRDGHGLGVGCRDLKRQKALSRDVLQKSPGGKIPGKQIRVWLK